MVTWPTPPKGFTWKEVANQRPSIRSSTAFAAVMSAVFFFAASSEVLTAAGTIEPIDPVRYIGNRSSGRMGYALAEEAVARGADVVLVSGPSALTPPKGLKSFISVETAAEMREAVLREAETSRIIIKAAAVAD